LTQSNELLNEIANLTIKFKMFNRFRCETQIAEPRQSLDIVANKEVCFKKYKIIFTF